MDDIIQTLAMEWGDEYTALSPTLRALVNDDWRGASYENQCAYRRNIGVGNLASYARCLAVD